MNENVAFPQNAKPARRPRPARGKYTAWKALSQVFSVALLVATMLTMVSTPAAFFANNMFDRMFENVQPAAPVEELPTITPSPRPRIGLVAGHYGNDSGSVCADGVTEMEVNYDIASRVKDILTKEGYEVDLLEEFDSRLTAYRALALVSIHNDSCDYINDQATGFKVSAAQSTVHPEKATRLTACMSQRYKMATNMSFHYNTITRDMTEYHAFSEIHNETTAAIIETGFLNLDREILTKRADLVAQGVANGILCFVRNEDLPQLPVSTP